MLDRSFDDDRRNMFEQIKSLLVAKIMVVQKTVLGINLTKELKEVQEWSYDSMCSPTVEKSATKRKSSLIM
jgi:Na+/alanine symporter